MSDAAEMKTEHAAPTGPREDAAADRAETASQAMRLMGFSLAVAGGLGALEVARNRFQRSQVFLPSRYPQGTWDPAEAGLLGEDVWFTSGDGETLHGWWLEFPGARGTVVYCHGNTGSIGDHAEAFRRLRFLGLNVLVFDYRGYGRSTGTPTEKGLFADVRAALDYVRDVRGKSLGRTLLFGHSLGGAVAIDGAAHRPVAGLVVQSSFTQLRDMARHRYPRTPLPLITRNEFRSIDKVPRLKMPKLFIHGLDDPTVPHAIGRQLFDAAAKPKRMLDVRSAAHNDVDLRGGLRYVWSLRRFCRRCLSV